MDKFAFLSKTSTLQNALAIFPIMMCLSKIATATAVLMAVNCWCNPAVSQFPDQNHQNLKSKRQLEGLLGFLTEGLKGLQQLPESALWEEGLRWMEKSPIHSVRDLTPSLHKDAVHQQVHYGPFIVPGRDDPSVGFAGNPHDVKGAFSFMRAWTPPCTDCMVLNGDMFVEHENGTRGTISTGIFNHHMVTHNHGRSEQPLICPGHPPMASVPPLFVWIGNDKMSQMFTSLDGNFKSGYYIRPNDTFSLNGELMNYHKESQKVFIIFDGEYLKGKRNDYLNTYSIDITVGPCWGTAFKLPSPQYSIETKPWTIPSNGYILNMRGHEHDGGSGIYVSLNGKVICKSIPVYGGNKDYVSGAEWETISEFPLCSDQVQVSKGDNLTVRADYDTILHPLRKSVLGHTEDVMGILGINIAFPMDFKFSRY